MGGPDLRQQRHFAGGPHWRDLVIFHEFFTATTEPATAREPLHELDRARHRADSSMRGQMMARSERSRSGTAELALSPDGRLSPKRYESVPLG